MYGITTHELSGSNFYAGTFPVAGAIFETEEDIEKGTVVEKVEDKVKAVTSATLSNMIGIASEDSVSGRVRVDFTGEILLSAVKLPDSVEEDALIDECRKHSIFLVSSLPG